MLTAMAMRPPSLPELQRAGGGKVSGQSPPPAAVFVPGVALRFRAGGCSLTSRCDSAPVSIHTVVRVGSTRVYIDQVTPNRDVKMVVRLGWPFPLHAGASSKALLAFLPEDQRRAYLETHHLVALTPHTITDPDRLRKELEAIRSSGFAVSFGERDASAGSVAAPVFGHEGTPIGVISVSGPLERFSAEAEQASRVLVDAARGLSQRLGYRDGRVDLDGTPATYTGSTAEPGAAGGN
jgi:DNA-binding IclR family transcriptional regulator